MINLENKRFHQALDVNVVRRTECIDLMKKMMEDNNKNIEKVDMEIEKVEEGLDDKTKILLALSDKTPWIFRSKELAEWTGIKAKECTKIIEEFIKEKKIIIAKKGKDGLYGATLELSNETETKKTKSTRTVLIGGSGVSVHAKGKD